MPGGATVRVYFDQGSTYTGHDFDAAHGQTLTASNGVIQLGRDPFQTGGSAWAAGHNLLLLDLPGAGGDEYCFLEPSGFNLAYWQGYRDVSHAATFTIQLGKEVNNDCRPQPPPTLVNEPYATSPSSSTAGISTMRKQGKKRYRVASVTLVDDSIPSRGMRNREIRVLSSSGRQLGAAVTDANGKAHLRVPAATRAIQIVDSTDNDLTLSAAAGPRSP